MNRKLKAKSLFLKFFNALNSNQIQKGITFAA